MRAVPPRRHRSGGGERPSREQQQYRVDGVKLIVFTGNRYAALETAFAAISGVERRLTRLLGRQALADLHATLDRIITDY